MNTANGSPQLKIGLSLPCCEIQELQSLYDIPEEFELLELSGELIGVAAQLMQSHPVLREFEFFNFRNLLPAKLTSQLTSAGGTIIAEYKKQLRELLSQAANTIVSSVFRHFYRTRKTVMPNVSASTRTGKRWYRNRSVQMSSTTYCKPLPETAVITIPIWRSRYVSPDRGSCR